MIFTLNDLAVLNYQTASHQKDRTMNRLRRFLFVAITMLYCATFALGGDIQTPGKSDPTPTPTPSALTTASTNDGLAQPTSTEIQIVWQDSATMFVEILLTIF